MAAKDEPIDYEAAVRDPAGCFGEPANVLTVSGLTRDQKAEILKRWETDARLLMTASEENMGGGEPPRLAEVQEALRALGVDPHELSQESGSKIR